MTVSVTPSRLMVAEPMVPVGVPAVVAAKLPPERTTSPPRMLNHCPFAVSSAKVCGVVMFIVPAPYLITLYRFVAPEAAVIGLETLSVPATLSVRPRWPTMFVSVPPELRAEPVRFSVLPAATPRTASKAKFTAPFRVLVPLKLESCPAESRPPWAWLLVPCRLIVLVRVTPAS